MLLRDLDRKNENPDVLLITTNSAMLDEFLRDNFTDEIVYVCTGGAVLWQKQ